MRAEKELTSAKRPEAGINQGDRRGFPEQRPQPTLTANPLQLKIAEGPPRDRVQRLLNLADSMLRETETLARDKAFTDESNRVRTLNLSEGIDFYDEVQRFETGADQTGPRSNAQDIRPEPQSCCASNQLRLNSKIKLYGIEY